MAETFEYRNHGNYWTGRGFVWIDEGNPLFGRIVADEQVVVGPTRQKPPGGVLADPDDELADVVDVVDADENADQLTLVRLARLA